MEFPPERVPNANDWPPVPVDPQQEIKEVAKLRAEIELIDGQDLALVFRSLENRTPREERDKKVWPTVTAEIALGGTALLGLVGTIEHGNKLTQVGVLSYAIFAAWMGKRLDQRRNG